MICAKLRCGDIWGTQTTIDATTWLHYWIEYINLELWVGENMRYFAPTGFAGGKQENLHKGNMLAIEWIV